MRTNLIVLRAGAGSLHPQWDDKEPEFDLLVSYYDDEPARCYDTDPALLQADGEYSERRPGLPWTANAEICAAFPVKFYARTNPTWSSPVVQAHCGSSRSNVKADAA